MPRYPIIGEDLNDDSLAADVEETPDPDPALAQNAANTDALAKAIVGAVNDAHGPRKVGFADTCPAACIATSRCSLARKVFQNGIQLFRDNLSVDAIEMVNRLTPGRYSRHPICRV